MFDREVTREWVLNLEGFKGHEPEEYCHLVEPLTDLVPKVGYDIGEDLNKLINAVLSARTQSTNMVEEASVTTQFLADRIKPWVEDIRQGLFHSKSAPFSCTEDAEIWLSEVENRMDDWFKRSDEWLKRANEWRARHEAVYEKYPIRGIGPGNWSELRKRGMPINEVERCLESLRVERPESIEPPPELDEQVKVYRALWDEILKIWKATGFTVKSVKMYVLTGEVPVLPSYTFGIRSETHLLPNGMSFLSRFATVIIRGELTFEDLRALYRHIRRELGIKRLKRPTEKQWQLYQIVQQKGPIPRKGTVAFWESVKQEWNNLHPQDKYKTWQGVKIAYERIKAQFERRITAKEA